jgi:hypothetical protein
MGSSLVEKVWGDVFEHIDDDLRAVTRYDGLDHEMKLRDDVRTEYTRDEDRAIVDQAILSQLSLDETEGAFKTGELESVILAFEDAWILQWSDQLKTKSGLLISIQRNGERASIADIEWCIEYLNEQIAPMTSDRQ